MTDSGTVIGIVSLLFAIAVVWQQNRVMRRQIQAQVRMNHEQISAQLRIAETQFKAEVLSRNRQEWINSLRDELAEFISYLTPLTEEPLDGEEDDPDCHADFVESKRQIDRCAAKIELLLNPNETDCAQLSALVKEIRALALNICDEASARKADRQFAKLNILVTDLVPLAQSILKKAWNRVKSGE